MPAVRARELARVAQALGFVFDRQRGSHAVYVRAADQRRVVIPMHAGADLKPKTLHAIIVDLGISREEFLRLL
ncbi:MAG TPA: type II toxin-antitoxin system HicA family toxin [Phycisphaerae bacterium]|nr:type II toxin-antitoxin system HicA family toxin [Phycisphaerae bacterium]